MTSPQGNTLSLWTSQLPHPKRYQPRRKTGLLEAPTMWLEGDSVHNLSTMPSGKGQSLGHLVSTCSLELLHFTLSHLLSLKQSSFYLLKFGTQHKPVRCWVPTMHWLVRWAACEKKVRGNTRSIADWSWFGQWEVAEDHDHGVMWAEIWIHDMNPMPGSRNIQDSLNSLTRFIIMFV